MGRILSNYVRDDGTNDISLYGDGKGIFLGDNMGRYKCRPCKGTGYIEYRSGQERMCKKCQGTGSHSWGTNAEARIKKREVE